MPTNKNKLHILLSKKITQLKYYHVIYTPYKSLALGRQVSKMFSKTVFYGVAGTLCLR